MAERGTPLALVASLPGLVLRLGWQVLRLQRVRKRGARAFEDALRSGDLSAERAAKLAQTYY